MDVKEAERIVIAKPVASRPTCSSFKSLELLSGAMNAAPSNKSSETAVPAIRPKTVRFKPMVNHAPARSLSSQVDISGVAIFNPSDVAIKSDGNSSVIYKPLAKVVSRATVSLLANMGNFSNSHQQTQTSLDSRVQHPKQDKYCLRSSQVSSKLHLNLSSQAATKQTIEPQKIAPQNQEDPKSLPSTANSDRPSYDRYNWRKYGQKQVKGSEHPRSYYKCTHPNCPVKKKVERSLDGQIAEIVYKGEHNHLKPQPSRRSSSRTQGFEFVSDATDIDTNNQFPSSHHLNERIEGSEERKENKNEVGLSGHSYQGGKVLKLYDSLATEGAVHFGGSPDNSCGLFGECEEISKGLKPEDDEPRSKRRKGENPSNEADTSTEGVQEPRLVVQNNTDSEIFSDGFRWRKYGQKIVKGSPYPRSYYRCTSLKCNVRKHVERASDDPRAFITTYEGKHNHEMPLRNSNPVSSDAETESRTSKDKP